MKIKTEGKWEDFDLLAIEAQRLQDEWLAWNTKRMSHYGNTWLSEGMISGNVWPNWSDEDRKTNRQMLARLYDALDKAIINRPKGTHTRTALNRLRSFLES